MTQAPPIQYLPTRTAPRSFREPIGVPSISIMDVFEVGWRAFTRHYGALLGLSLLNFAISIGVTIVAGIVGAIIPMGGMAQILMQGPMMSGIGLVGVQAVRGEPPSTTHLFAGFSRYWLCVGVVALQTVLGIALVVPFMVAALIVIGAGSFGSSPGNNSGWIVGGILGGLVALVSTGAFIYCYLRLSFAPVILLDADLGSPGVIDAFKTSWKLTRTTFWPLLGLAVFLVLLSAASFLLLILPYFLFALPLWVALNGAAYIAVRGPIASQNCEWCGYDLTGLASGICPECGGARTPTHPPAAPPTSYPAPFTT